MFRKELHLYRCHKKLLLHGKHTAWGAASPIKCPLTKQQPHRLLRHNFFLCKLVSVRFSDISAFLNSLLWMDLITMLNLLHPWSKRRLSAHLRLLKLFSIFDKVSTKAKV